MRRKMVVTKSVNLLTKLCFVDIEDGADGAIWKELNQNVTYPMKAIVLTIVAAQCSLADEARVTADDYAVIRTVMLSATPQNSKLATYIWHVAERSQVYDYNAMEGFRESFQLLSDELFDGYNRRNWDRREAVPLKDSFNLPQPTIPLTPELMRQHLGRVLDPGWRINPSRLPNAGLVVKLSLPSYSSDSAAAFVFVGLYQPAKSDAGYFVLHRQSDKSWKIVEKVTWWGYEGPDYTSHN